MATLRGFYIGESIHFQLMVSELGTKKPVDPDNVDLISLKLGGSGANLLGSSVPFVYVNKGEYSYGLSTSGLGAGTYEVVVRVQADEVVGVSPEKVKLVKDTFVLSAI